MSAPVPLPAWADRLLMPLLALATAALAAALLLLGIGENPADALAIMLRGALGSGEGIGFTLYYATNFIFTGLAVALAYHAGLFNIGAEGQATMAGIGAALFIFAAEPITHGFVLIPIGIVGAMIFGAVWAAIPGWLQAWRGSHVVITTIMFNFLAAIVSVYLLVNVIGKEGSMQPETRLIADGAQLWTMQAMLGALGFKSPSTPLNFAFVLALLAAFAVWVLIFRSKFGFHLRLIGVGNEAARYAGINTRRMIVLAMALSGALAAGMAVNEVMGVQHRVVIEFTSGYGFVGIAVALMGRNHPVGVILSALLFGALYQGGTELAFERPAITRDLIVTLSGLVIFCVGALDQLYRKPLAQLLARREPG